MRAIILAAGTGKRLAKAHAGKPKCLLEIGGISLLHRHLAALKRYAIEEVFIVTGYQSAMIANALNVAASTARILFNPDYLAGSMLSLWVARRALLGAKEVVLMDADVFYDERLLLRLLHSNYRSCLLLDRDFEQGEEPVKAYIKNKKIIALGKQIDAGLEYDTTGESVGFFKFSHPAVVRLLDCAKTYIDAKDTMAPHENAIHDLVRQAPPCFGYEDITGTPWVEIDFPKDVVTAENVILPAIGQ